MKKRIIAIDGPVGSGKTTVARRVADLLGYMHIDSGAMYRALGLKALRTGVPLDNDERLEQLADETQIEMHRNAGRLQVLLDSEDITDHIRTAGVSMAASKVALVPEVRRILVAEQRRAGHHGGVVMEGRDIGTVVFPDADLKIYLDATAEVRAERRLKEHVARGDNMDFDQWSRKSKNATCATRSAKSRPWPAPPKRCWSTARPCLLKRWPGLSLNLPARRKRSKREWKGQATSCFSIRGR